MKPVQYKKKCVVIGDIRKNGRQRIGKFHTLIFHLNDNNFFCAFTLTFGDIGFDCRTAQIVNACFFKKFIKRNFLIIFQIKFLNPAQKRLICLLHSVGGELVIHQLYIFAALGNSLLNIIYRNIQCIVMFYKKYAAVFLFKTVNDWICNFSCI